MVSLVIGVCLLVLSCLSANAQSPQILSLSDSIELAVTNNKTIQSAYLDRIAQQFDLRVAEDKFNPKLYLSPGIERTQSNASNVSSSLPGTTTTASQTGAVTTAGLSSVMNQALVTGAKVSVSATQASVRTVGGDPYRSSAWNISLVQPLLKGAGIEVSNASVAIARYAEQANILALKSVITDALIEVTSTYRAYFKAMKALTIGRQSLSRSRDLLVINRSLIAVGRMAEIDPCSVGSGRSQSGIQSGRDRRSDGFGATCIAQGAWFEHTSTRPSRRSKSTCRRSGTSTSRHLTWRFRTAQTISLRC
jgi:outer membrane protein TolC